MSCSIPLGSHLFPSDDLGARTLPVPTSGLSQNRDIRVRAEVVHFCNTTKRIRFREVKLQPKSTMPNAQTQKPIAQNAEDGDLLYPEASETQVIQGDPENDMEVDSEAS